jgi:hypothetical protein
MLIPEVVGDALGRLADDFKLTHDGGLLHPVVEKLLFGRSDTGVCQPRGLKNVGHVSQITLHK